MINPNSGSVISLKDAQDLVSEFKAKFPKEIKGLFVGVNHVNDILSQQGCIGIRIYHGYSENHDRLSHVLVGVDENGNDMTNGLIVDRMVPCPTMCDNNSPLNID
jgi:hypothetical protein